MMKMGRGTSKDGAETVILKVFLTTLSQQITKIYISEEAWSESRLDVLDVFN